MAPSRYSQHQIHYIRGKMENTIPAHLPEDIALLRLDKDLYE
jgi:hypothetical protein